MKIKIVKGSKYYKKHGTCKHNTSQCRSIKRFKTKSNDGNDEEKKTFVLRDPLPKI